MLFQDYNFKSYAVRRIKCGYAENRTLSDKAVIAAEYEKGVKELESLKRSLMFVSPIHVLILFFQTSFSELLVPRNC